MYSAAACIPRAASLTREAPSHSRSLRSIASEVGHGRIVRALIRAGANVDAPKNDDSTALIAAAYFGRTEIVELLLEANASLEARDGDGTAFDNAWKQKHDAVIEMLRAAQRHRAALAAHGLIDDDVEDEVEAGRDGGEGEGEVEEVEEEGSPLLVPLPSPLEFPPPSPESSSSFSSGIMLSASSNT